MTATIDYEDLVRMLRGASELVRENRERLSELDSHGGDGDHGMTMVRAMDQLEGAILKAESPAVDALLKGIGWAILGVDGGATGPLFGSFFMAMAGSAGEGPLDPTQVAAAFEAGLAGVRKNTRAAVGDKTLLDALVPAVEGLRAAVDEGAAIDAALERAAEAARLGAESTVLLQARFGRAKNVGEASKGYADPGATSVALIFQAFARGAKQNG